MDATLLRHCFNTEELAKFMHQNYRAAFKALHTMYWAVDFGGPERC
jgi:hypothetical protein